MRHHLAITGDVHGKMQEYVPARQKDCNYSIQIGDLSVTTYNALKPLDPKKHKFFGGNHDNYTIYHKCPHSMGDYGNYEVGGLKFFFIRGAFSIDFKPRQVFHRRTGRISWWEDEQLSMQDMEKAYQAYMKAKPHTMLTHGCPREIARIIGKPEPLKMFGFDPNSFTTNTQELLQRCFEYHKPRVWIYGHFHQTRSFFHKNTLFTCLNELETMYINKNGTAQVNGYTYKTKVGQ